jgi:ADP-ribosylglycohydrolase
VTHAHPEGQAGAVAVALGAAWAARGEGPLIDFVLDHWRESGPTREGIERARALGNVAPWQAARDLGNGSQAIASDTVPFCLWIAAHYSDDYAQALWHAVGQFGDADTNCAIVGGIVALRSETPVDCLRGVPGG